MMNGELVWLDWMVGLRDTGGSADTYAGISGYPIVDFEIEEATLGPGGWYRKNMVDGKLIGLTVYYSTPHPDVTGYYAAKYRVRWLSDPPAWGKWELDDDDNGAGNDSDPIDMVELTICRL